MVAVDCRYCRTPVRSHARVTVGGHRRVDLLADGVPGRISGRNVLEQRRLVQFYFSGILI